MIGKLEDRDFDKWLSLSEKAARDEAVASNDAFVLAMAKAVKRGREKVTAGTYVDTSTSSGVRRVIPQFPISACGSPAAMCLESAVQQQGAEAMK